MPDLDDLARRYLAGWNERDPVRRRALVGELWTDDAGYVDPIVVADGRDEIDAAVAAAQRRFPGLVYRQEGTLDVHHHVARLPWALAPPGGPPVIIGLTVLVAGPDRLRRGYGFLDPVPVHTPDPGAEE